MSYDLFVAPATVGEDDLWDACSDTRGYDTGIESYGDPDTGAYFNYTYNLGRFLTAYKVNPIRDLDGLTAKECAHRIDTALRDIEQEDQGMLADLYNPANNWGSVAGATNWLRVLRRYCLDHPLYLVRE
ncbi:hypothetical protein [Bifidobacterium sp. SO1]|uniref:hypothetical protein n=1 Tax=Bifidobacterium sp. SO1 TaxID=2809029 RepID=UPI001BDC7D56|nr:hypothetical protein [Bifidobacterium sp. SO1]MBT1161258.1 hypothetical protein [Bifidobacterium sp. SO1]